MRKAKPFPETSCPVLTGMNPDDTISRAEVAALIRDHCYPGLDAITRRHRAHSMVSTATAKGHLRADGPDRYRLDTISDWLASKIGHASRLA